jgi:hypothetical protein
MNSVSFLEPSYIHIYKITSLSNIAMNGPNSGYKIVFTLALMLITTKTFSQNQPNEDRLTNFVVKTVETGNAIPFSFVANMRTGDGKETKGDGSFNMFVAPGDSLIFKCLGYADTTWVVSDKNLLLDTIPLNVEQKSFTLNEVKIYQWRSYAAFKQMFLSLKVPSEEPISFSFNINTGELNALAKAKSGTFGLTAPMGGKLWVPKEKRKLNALLAYEKRRERLNRLTSHENLMAFTGFEGERLDSFVIFLRKNYAIKPYLSDYKIMAAVQIAYEEFLAAK